MAYNVGEGGRIFGSEIRTIRISTHLSARYFYLPNSSQLLSVSTRWQNGHYPVDPDGAGAGRIHSLAT